MKWPQAKRGSNQVGQQERQERGKRCMLIGICMGQQQQQQIQWTCARTVAEQTNLLRAVWTARKFPLAVAVAVDSAVAVEAVGAAKLEQVMPTKKD